MVVFDKSFGRRFTEFLLRFAIKHGDTLDDAEAGKLLAEFLNDETSWPRSYMVEVSSDAPIIGEARVIEPKNSEDSSDAPVIESRDGEGSSGD